MVDRADIGTNMTAFQNQFKFVNYNKRQICRIYPKGTRVDSSNFMPQVIGEGQVVLSVIENVDIVTNMTAFKNQLKFVYYN